MTQIHMDLTNGFILESNILENQVKNIDLLLWTYQNNLSIPNKWES
jgi:hypothetical protein